jgi:hypothetical protein
MVLPSRLPSQAAWRKQLMLKLQRLRLKNILSPVVLPVPMIVAVEVLVTLRKDERRCDFGMCLPFHVIYSYFDDFVNFGCHAQASQLFEPVRFSLPHLIITKPKDDVVDIHLAILKHY